MALAFLLAVPSSFAQPQVVLTEKAPFLAAALSQFISDTRSFTASAELTVRRGADAEPVKLPFGVALDMGKMRFDLNLAQVTTSTLGADSVKAMQDMALDRLMFMYFPGQPLRIVFPGMKAYVEMPVEGQLPQVQNQAADQASRLVKTPAGPEVVDGQPTQKFRLTVPGSKSEAHVWEAPALNNLPVRLAVQSGAESYDFAFRNVRQGQVDPRVFGIPATFKKYGALHEVLTAGAMQSLGSVLKGLQNAQP